MILKGNSGGARATSKPAAQKLPLKSTIEVVSAKHVARKKKKRSTKLKKKLLNERLNYYESLHAPAVTSTVAPEPVAVMDAPLSTPQLTSMVLRNFLDDSIEDEEELKEVVDSAHDIVSTFGKVLSLEVQTINEESSPDRVLFIEFSSPLEAERACQTMHNSIYGGTAVHAELVHSERLSSIDTHGSKEVSAAEEKPVQSGSVSSVLESDVPGEPMEKAVVLSGINNDKRMAYENHSTIYIQNFVNLDDIEDEDEAEDVLNDTLFLCDKFSPSGLWIENSDQYSFVPYTPCRTAPGGQAPCPVGVLSFDSLDSAAACRDCISQACGISTFLANSNVVKSGVVDKGSLFGASFRQCDENRSGEHSLEMNNFFCLRIRRFVTTDEITDDDEREEIVNEIRNLCNTKVQDYRRGDTEERDVVVDCIIFGNFSDCDHSPEYEQSKDELDVLVFANLKNHALGDTLRLLNALTGVHVGGVPLVLSVCCTYDKVLREMISSHNVSDTVNVLSESVRQLHGCLADLNSEDLHQLDCIFPADATLFLVVVLGLPWRLPNSSCISETADLSHVDLLKNNLWRYEWKLSLLQLCGFSDASSLLTLVVDQKVVDSTTLLESYNDFLPTHLQHLRNISVCGCILPLDAESDALKSSINDSPGDVLNSPSLEVCVSFGTKTRALAAMLYLERLIIGGSELVVSIRIGKTIENANLTENFVHKVPGSSFDNSVSVVSTYGLSPTAEEFVPKMASTRNNISATPQTSPAESKGLSSQLAVSIPAIAVSSLGAESGPPVIPRLPKKTSINYDIKHATSDINDTVKTFLSLLATFQKRVKETDPLNFNRKRRLLFGMKQARNSIKSGRAKAIFIAPDFEDSEALDEKLDELIQEARAKETPLLCCLSRRQLAKATGNSMRQVVVAVLDADGAYDHYKTILKYIACPT